MTRSKPVPQADHRRREESGASVLHIMRKLEEVHMLDILFIAIGFAFLGGAMLYVRACDRL